ncbi:hypothetical protein ZIOFF_040855 [Zingiber officinale]|uniref:Heparan-alpha-glucosaminide N-acetyltransferase catalytic domain-containing protein n=1 Tax=Zingiber officinale TaxID=94328 RepID=A0A8J5G6S9_ZINOF|nr:hypothetical protein ZIOFF_040855 [Zingiber officinale]
MESIVVAVEQTDRTPLLQCPATTNSSSAPLAAGGDEISPSPSPPPNCAADLSANSSQRRLASLDVFRGFTVALMILVDDAGGAFPSINHAPWFGVTLADFVMPFFLFGVGISVALVFKRTPSKVVATKKVLLRTTNLFLLGLLLQGGYFHGRNNLTYGVDLDRIRWFGILQRISIAYLLAALCEVWLVSNVCVDSTVSYVKKYYIEWIVAILLSATYVSLLLGLYVPSWEFEAPGNNSTLPIPFYVTTTKTVNLEFAECSVNSPDYGPLPENSPSWCLAPFDPEGLLSSLMAAVTCFAGLHFGHLIVHLKLIGMPFSKPLYTLSYMFLTTGVSGFLFILMYFIVDVQKFKRPFILFQWMGMNALIVYILAASELFPAFVQGFYWHSPENNLVNLTESMFQTIFQSKRWGTLAFVLLEILFWCLAAGFLHMRGIYIKL